MRHLGLIAVSMLSFIACSSDAESPPGYVPANSDSGMALDCVDEDEDGFGDNCGYRDCDDDDPTVTNECFRCVGSGEVEDCPCEPGTAPVECEPPSYEGEQNGVRGTFICEEGTRYCRDSLWSECEVVGEYVFVPLD